MVNWNKLLKDVVDAPCLSVFEALDNPLGNMIELLFNPEMVRELDYMIAVGAFQLKYSILL